MYKKDILIKGKFRRNNWISFMGYKVKVYAIFILSHPNIIHKQCSFAGSAPKAIPGNCNDAVD